MRTFFWPGLIMPLALACGPQPARAEVTNQPVLTNAAAVRSLSREQADLKVPARIEGVVTYSNPEWRVLFIDDGTGGVYAALGQSTFPTNGEQVEVVGRSGQGSVLSVVDAASWRSLGAGTLPVPRPIDQSSYLDTEVDCAWSQIEGVVRKVTSLGTQTHWQLDVARRGNLARAFCQARDAADVAALTNLVDSLVSITGVSGIDPPASSGAKVLKIFVPSRRQIQVLRAPRSNPFDVQPVPIASLRGSAQNHLPEHLVRVQGAITYLYSATEFTLQDREHGIRVQAREPGSYELGQALEAVGFATARDFSPALEHTVTRAVTGSVRAVPVAVKSTKVLWGDHDAELLQLIATLETHTYDGTNHTWTLQSDGVRFGVSLRSASQTGPWDQLKSGDHVLITGVCEIQGSQRNAPQSFRVLLRDAQDLVYVSRLRSYSVAEVLAILAVATGVAGGVFLWGITLRRKVREQTAVIEARLEKELALERRYRELLENAVFPVVIFCRATLRVLYLNQRAASRFRVQMPLGPDTLASELCDSPATLQLLLSGLGERGYIAEAELPMKVFGGASFWTLACASAIDFEDRPAVLLSINDITRRKQAEEALREGQSRFEALFSQSLVGAAQIRSGTGRIVRVNQRLCEMLGYGEHELQTADFLTLAHPEDRALAQEALQRCTSQAMEQVSIEARHLRQDRSVVWFSLRVLPLWQKDQSPDFLLALVEDISDRRCLEERLRQAQKMEGIGHLAGGMAHEFNNILASMMLNLSLAQMDAKESETRETLQGLEDSCKRAATLVRQLLAFSCQSFMQREALDLRTVVAAQLKTLQEVLGSAVVLEFSCPEPLPRVKADPGLIEQVLVNLCLNARDAMKTGGRVNLDLRTVDVALEQCRAQPEARPGRYVRLSVADTGCGMEERTVKRLFEPFFTTKDVGEGTGLGLATVRGITQQHQGWVEAQSTLGKGSTFRVYLPVTEGVQPRLADPKSKPAPAATRTILLVEDDPRVLAPTASLLTQLGYRVLEAANGSEALAVWANHRPQIDLIYTDMVMPGELSGLEVAERALAEKPGLKVIITSGYNPDLRELEAASGGAIRFLPKPCPTPQLSSAIADFLLPGPEPCRARP
jgi:PAS domain S-box-containing protein